MDISLTQLRELLFPFHTTALEHEKSHAIRAIGPEYSCCECAVISPVIAYEIKLEDPDSAVFVVVKDGPATLLWTVDAWRNSSYRKMLERAKFNAHQKELATVQATTEAELAYRKNLVAWVKRLAQKISDATEGLHKVRFLTEFMLGRLSAVRYDVDRFTANMRDALSEEHFDTLWISPPQKQNTNEQTTETNTETPPPTQPPEAPGGSAGDDLLEGDDGVGQEDQLAQREDQPLGRSEGLRQDALDQGGSSGLGESAASDEGA